jgi:hypothetical protein
MKTKAVISYVMIKKKKKKKKTEREREREPAAAAPTTSLLESLAVSLSLVL